MRRKIVFIALSILMVAAALFAYFYFRAEEARESGEWVLYGNMDDREVRLPFVVQERIATLLPEEGMTVKKGELVATLETVRIQNQVNRQRAATEAARQNFERVRNGPRPEEIEVERAILAAAEANLFNTTRDYERQKTLAADKAVSVQVADQAEAKYRIAVAGVNMAQKRLELLLTGRRAEDVAEAKAQYEQAQAELAVNEQILTDTSLYSPVAGIVRQRLLEPGELAAPGRPVLLIAQTDPKWVRAYLPESMLGRVALGGAAKIEIDSFPGRSFAGWVGYISPTAEFTPKNVETPDLRTALVYEVRVYVKDPEGLLKLGVPATVRLPRLAEK